MVLLDLKITGDLDVKRDGSGDLPLVSGRDAYNQTIALGTLGVFYNEIGTLDKAGALTRLKEAAQDIARQFPEYISEIEAVRAEFGDEAKTVAEVTIVYDTDEDFTFPVQ